MVKLFTPGHYRSGPARIRPGQENARPSCPATQRWAKLLLEEDVCAGELSWDKTFRLCPPTNVWRGKSIKKPDRIPNRLTRVSWSASPVEKSWWWRIRGG